MAATGKMRYITKEFNFEWQIEDYFSHISNCRSPSFSFAGELWHLRIYPSGLSNFKSQECVCLYLSRETSGPPIDLAWSWGLETFDGKIDHEGQFKRVFVNTRPQGTIRFVNRYTLKEKKSELVPYDVLTIVFTVECCSKSNDGASYTVTATCPYCKKESASSHEHKCLDKPIRCPTCSDVVALREWFDHECEIARIKGCRRELKLKNKSPFCLKNTNLSMAISGKLHNLTAEFHFEWQIDNFFSVSEKDGGICFSPRFSFAGESWYLGIGPNDTSENNLTEYIQGGLYRKLNGPPITVAWSLGVKTFEGKGYEGGQFTHVFEKAGGWGFLKFLKRCDLSEKKSELVPSDVLTLVCHIDYYSKSKDGADNTVTVKCSHCKRDLVADCASSHEQKCLYKPTRCPTCSDEVALRNWSDHECETARVIATKKLFGDLADILESEEHSDVTIRVKDKEFRLHRSMLAGRNSYFRSMFKTEMKEKNTGIVSIDDCEPDIFKSFINFVYVGKVLTLSCDNVCALYEVAGKYQEDQLKAECLCFMKNRISVDSFVDFVVLALKHNEKELLQNATDLFCKQIKEIIQSVKWQNFVRDYPTQANELHIKAVDYYVK